MESLKNLKILIVGGDRREAILYHIWNKAGLRVKMAGFEENPHIEAEDLITAESGFVADVLITPLNGIKDDGSVTAEYTLRKKIIVNPYIKTAGKPLLLAGSIESGIKTDLGERTRICLTADDPELALLNAVPTAEGAIQMAMEISDITLHGSCALIIGLGRCGTVLARTLAGLGAKVSAVIRRRETAAEAYTQGFNVYTDVRLAEAVSEADFVFNTAPAMVLTSDILEKVKKEAIILDLAAKPGGTDFSAAGKLGLTAVLLPGLPGKVAPRTAGRILATVYPKIILDNLMKF